jgi:hypothetical protein
MFLVALSAHCGDGEMVAGAAEGLLYSSTVIITTEWSLTERSISSMSSVKEPLVCSRGTLLTLV